jgi:hypothetical protein
VVASIESLGSGPPRPWDTCLSHRETRHIQLIEIIFP